MIRRTLLVEDDYTQAAGIQETIGKAFAANGINTTITHVVSEEAAYQEIAKIVDAQTAYNLFVIDLMLPWTRSDEPEYPNDPRVVEDGALDAGCRIHEKIRQNSHVANTPIILYTVLNGTQKKFDELTFFQTKSIDDEQLKELISKKVIPVMMGR
jgi:CheY-like chemotaxis protein